MATDKSISSLVPSVSGFNPFEETPETINKYTDSTELWFWIFFIYIYFAFKIHTIGWKKDI